MIVVEQSCQRCGTYYETVDGRWVTWRHYKKGDPCPRCQWCIQVMAAGIAAERQRAEELGACPCA